MFCERFTPLRPSPMMMIMRYTPWEEYERIPHTMEEVMDFMNEWCDEDHDELVIRPRRMWHELHGFTFPHGRNGLKIRQRKSFRQNKKSQDTCQHGKPSSEASDETASDNEVTEANSKKLQEQTQESTIGVPKTRSEEPWKFDMDITGCDQVHAFIESGMLTVEGRGENANSRMMIRHSTSLPPHVDPCTLKATRTTNNRLIVTYDPQPQIENRKELPITHSPQHTTSDGEKEEQSEKASHQQKPAQEIQNENEA